MFLRGCSDHQEQLFCLLDFIIRIYSCIRILSCAFRHAHSIILIFPNSFPEPTCLLVSSKTRSSGIIKEFPETKILGLQVSRRMRGLVYMASRDKVEEDTFHKGILEKLGKSKFGFERTAVFNNYSPKWR